MQIDLNADLGEGFGRYTVGDDEALLRVVSSANIACGLHAGDPLVMARTVRVAASRGVAIGAHPGYPDLQGFGRRALTMAAEELEAVILYQLGALAGFCQAEGAQLRHVKAHGALYNTAAREPTQAASVARAIAAFDPGLIVVTMPGSALAQAAKSLHLAVAYEGFADRAYEDDGTLASRNRPGAVLHDPPAICERAVRMAAREEVVTVSGKVIRLRVDTICIHGDTPGAAEIAATLRQALEEAGIQIVPLTTKQLRATPEP